jgi:hypothetical protein
MLFNGVLMQGAMDFHEVVIHKVEESFIYEAHIKQLLC